jgi:hypothetical protein
VTDEELNGRLRHEDHSFYNKRSVGSVNHNNNNNNITTTNLRHSATPIITPPTTTIPFRLRNITFEFEIETIPESTAVRLRWIPLRNGVLTIRHNEIKNTYTFTRHIVA